MINLLDEDSYDERGINLPAFYEGNCAQQRNGYDCGPYVIEYMGRAVNTIAEKKGIGFGDMHPEDWILEYPRKLIRQEVKRELAARAKGCKEATGQQPRVEREKEREKRTRPIQTYIYLPKVEDRGCDLEIISEQVSENKMEVTEQTEEDDWTVVSHKSAARRNNANKTERNGEMGENRRHTENDERKNTEDRNTADNSRTNKVKKTCSYWITDKCKFGQKCKNEHPTRCREHNMDWGECEKKNCEFEHPKMCRNMIKDSYCSRSNCRFNHPNKMKNMHEIRNGKHSINYNQNQRGPKRQENQNMQGNPNTGNPAAWQNNNRDRYQCPSGTSFLAETVTD